MEQKKKTKKKYSPPEIKEKPMTRHFMICAQNAHHCPPGSARKFDRGSRRCF
jgi:hypothetical protein